MARGKKTDNAKIAEIMTSYALTNSYNATAKECDVSDSTVKKIILENQEEFGKVREQKKEEFIDKASRIIDKAMNKLEVQIDNNEVAPNHLTTIIGTLYDKRALAKGETTENNKVEVTIKVEE